jgi:hypothetical protein
MNSEITKPSKEIWKDIPEGPWQISNWGRLRYGPKGNKAVCKFHSGPAVRFGGEPIKTWRQRACKKDKDKLFRFWYLGTVLTNYKGKKVMVFPHREVCKAFHGPRRPGMTVNHINGRRGCNWSTNIQWCTMADNIAMGIARRKKDKWELVCLVRQLHKTGWYSRSLLKQIFNINDDQIRRMLDGFWRVKIWKANKFRKVIKYN